METPEAVTNGGTGDKSMEAEPTIKQEDEEKDVKFGIEVKTEPGQEKEGEEETSVRSTRKRKLNSMAETSDLSDEQSDDENFTTKTPAKRGRGRGAASGGRSGSTRGRGKARDSSEVPANMADPTRNPRIVLKNIASSQEGTEGLKVNMDSPRGRGRGRGRGGGGRQKTPRAAETKSRAKAKAAEEEDDDDEDDEEEEDEDDEDFDAEDLDEDEDFVPKKKKGGRPARQSATRGRKSKGKGGKKASDEDDEDGEEDEEEEDAANNAAEDAAVSNNPNAVKTGQYLIEKNDMKRLENFPIWRLEGPNMLRKFEMTVVDGRVRHKSLYAYSSWAQSMIDLYEKIQVDQVSSTEGETVVEIKDEYMPKPPEFVTLEGKFADDPLLNWYNVYVQAMFRQAVDHSFLKKIRNDNDVYFLDALSHIDTLIKDKITAIESEVSLKEDFKTRVRNCPNMKSIRRQNWSQTDQATTNKMTEKGVRSVLLYGFGYDPFLMEEDKSQGVEVAQEVVVGPTVDHYLSSYHGLIHFKFTLLKRCMDKISLLRELNPGTAPAAAFEKCVQDRVWIYQTFEDLKNLLSVASPSPST